MRYEKPLPLGSAFLELARSVHPFPTTAGRVLEVALRTNAGPDVVSFIRLFSPNEVFQNRSDLLTRLDGLAMLIAEEQDMPKEQLRNPQE